MSSELKLMLCPRSPNDSWNSMRVGIGKIEADRLGPLVFLKVASNRIRHVNMKFLKAGSPDALAINPPSGASLPLK